MREFVTERTCGASGVSTRTLSAYGELRLREALVSIREGDPMYVVPLIKDVLGDMKEVEIGECPVVDVEVEITAHGTGLNTWIERWTCPVCRTEHEEEMHRDDLD